MGYGMASTVNKGFHLNFENGVSISVQWGYGNYGNNRDITKRYREEMENEIFSANSAEVEILKGNKNITEEFSKKHGISGDGTTMGWVSADMVAEAVYWAKNYKG